METADETPFGVDLWEERIPICNEGVDVSNITDGKKDVYLKTQCPLWEDEEFNLEK